MFSTLKNTVFINEPVLSRIFKKKNQKNKKPRAVQFQNSRGKNSNISSPLFSLLHDNPPPPPAIWSSEFYLNILKVE